MKKLLVATFNAGKVREFRSALQSRYEVVGLADKGEHFDWVENGDTFEANALIKIKATRAQYGCGTAILADDSGLCVDSLNGKPGIFSSRYAGESASDEENVAKLLNDMSDVADGSRQAKFVCCLAFLGAESDCDQVAYFRGECYGQIAFERKGSEGFGYDPVFVPDGFSLSLAQFSLSEKNRLSHRTQALRKMQNHLLSF